MPTSIVVLQRLHAGPRADEMLDQLQIDVDVSERARWTASGHARLDSSEPLDDARASIAARLDAVDGDWTEHMTIL